jgi:histidine ammonia-lyase
MAGYKTVTLDGGSLDIQTLSGLSCGNESRIEICDRGFEKIQAARRIVEKYLEKGTLAYGLTTGLGAKVSEKLSYDELSEFSYQTIRGRAHALGDPMPRESVRGAMIVRLNSMLLGTSGASPEIAIFLQGCLNRDITPVVGSIGSIGASDLCIGASMAMAMIGEGVMKDGQGNTKPSAIAIREAGLVPLALGPKDGLALINHSGFSAALSAFAVRDAKGIYDAIQLATAMSLEAFRANLSPLDKFVQRTNPQPSHNETASQLRDILKGSRLFSETGPREIQDPLSIRNVVQVNGTILAAIIFAKNIVEIELNACSDNPVVDIEAGRIISGGGYLSAHLTLAVETVSRAINQMVAAQLSRMSKLLANRHTGLPRFLALPESSSNGFAPVMKIAEDLVAQIKKLLCPVDFWPGINAGGVEDIQSLAPLAATSLCDAILHCEKLCALEMIIAAQALELGNRQQQSPGDILAAYTAIRSIVPALEGDRPMGQDIERLANWIRTRRLP